MDIQAMMAQAQDLQKKMLEAQDAARAKTVEATVGGGMVTVVMTGGLEVRSLKIDPAVVNPDERGMLEDLIAAAVNQALQKAQQLMNDTVQQALGPLAALAGQGGLPGMF